MHKLLLALLCCAFFLSTATASANSLHDIQDNIQTDKALHFAAGYIISDQLQNAGCSAFEAFLITSAIAWGKEKLVDDHVDNNDAYATMAGSIFYQIKF